MTIPESIDTPVKLLNWMSKNIEYEEDMENYFLKSPDDLVRLGKGVCWDQAELERAWFSKHGYESKVIYIQQFNKECSTHSFLIYKDKDKWAWFEHSYSDHKGIHKGYEHIRDCICDVYEKMYYDIGDYGFTAHLLKKPKFGMSVSEYMDFALGCKKICSYEER